MKIINYDKTRLSPIEEKKSSLIFEPLKFILKNADFITIHTPLTRETHHLFSDKEFSLMKKTAFIINTSRGPIIDEKALIKALKEQKIAGCALDVFENEPEISEALIKMDNVLLLPHIGSATLETRTNMAFMCAENLIAALIKNRIPPNLVNPGVLNIKE
jgi:glyoxylate reductase